MLYDDVLDNKLNQFKWIDFVIETLFMLDVFVYLIVIDLVSWLNEMENLR